MDFELVHLEHWDSASKKSFWLLCLEGESFIKVLMFSPPYLESLGYLPVPRNTDFERRLCRFSVSVLSIET